jgi:hypothetical protein
MVLTMNDLKKQVFFDMMKLAGRVFVLVEYSDRVVIGRRGFLPEEKEKGIILVFNDRMKFDWDHAGISATLSFGTGMEKCFVPADSVISIFSPELSAQFSVTPRKQEEEGEPSVVEPAEGTVAGDKVVRVDFKKKR